MSVYQSRSLLGWITNDPDAAKVLRRADNRYTLAKIRAQGLTLAEKIDAHRAARTARDAEYQTVRALCQEETKP